jgi:hypothetical protein
MVAREKCGLEGETSFGRKTSDQTASLQVS